MSTPTIEGSRHAVVTSDDRGAVLQIAAWVMMVTMILFTLSRLLIRITTAHVPGLDDMLVSIAMLSGVSEVIAISLGVNHGLGKRSASLSRNQVLQTEKAIYASTLLYVLTLAFAKASTLVLLARIANVKRFLHIIYGTMALVCLWTITSLFVTGFQCHLPLPWDAIQGTCLNTVIVWDAIGVVDILTDLVLVFIPIQIVWRLQMKRDKKHVIMVAFGFRLAAIAAQIVRLRLLKRSPSDLTFDTLDYQIATLCHTTLAVIVTCIPALKPFMDRTGTGLMAIDLEQRDGTYGNPNSYRLQKLSGYRGTRSNNTTQGPRSASKPEQDTIAVLEDFRHASRPDRSSQQATISAMNRKMSGRAPDDNLLECDMSDKYIIQKTLDFDVAYSDETQQGLHTKRSGEVHNGQHSEEMMHAKEII